MTNAILKALAAGAVVLAVASFTSDTSAQEKKAAPKAKPPPACNSLNNEKACTGRDDCTWVAAVKDAKGKQTRRAYCRAKPKPKPAPAPKKK